MGMMKHYFLALICIGTTQAEQEAIEWALVQGWFKPIYNFDEDKAAIETQLPDLVQRFQQVATENEATQQLIYANDSH